MPAGDPDPDEQGPSTFEFASGESIHVDPERIKAGREQRKRMADRADDLSFRKTMVPLLLAVGVLLLGISGLTAAMTAGGDENVPVEERSALEEYGPLLIWAGLPLGLVLVGGAVIFHMEVRRLEAARVLSASASQPQTEEPKPNEKPKPEEEPEPNEPKPDGESEAEEPEEDEAPAPGE